MKKIATVLGYSIFLFLTLFFNTTVAQPASQLGTKTSNTVFEPINGDRVVFVGNSLFENDLTYGYLELALTTRWPNRNFTFRNIGWTGDTVWGEARSYISPPTTYDLLIEQLTKAQPTVVFIAYGAMEALEGEQGLSRFKEGLNKLIDKIDQLGAKTILLSAIPLMEVESGEDIGKRNSMLELYTAAIAKIAEERGKQYLNIYTPVLEKNKIIKLSDNGFHLNETGYYYLASVVEKELGLSTRTETASIDIAKQEATATIKVLNWGKNNGNLTFTISESLLPLPLPRQEEGAEKTRIIKINGLKKGIYTLSTENFQVVTASAKQWNEGVEIKQGGSYSQASQLREMIIKKNELYFHQYRPQNKTYILGFRSHEQGRHTKGLEDLSIIITWLEGQIAINRAPKEITYQLTPVK
ncbi:SGNH/GDSL hydrolase family protein [Rhodocytophaga rosea]|uniref:SGNH/GDSL hydrolase family protein n=1 Tax=Rhodocytophaga rosea TaxID=2704465 RepID=A0A6C0GHC6_9BACT|nr:SGNH/GDSL hydrolase family protein [Rhodocytophaga rosea]QHT67295.1 SGNH/GDSL hydrolase family protein [Rhodocytophaga rosea]